MPAQARHLRQKANARARVSAGQPPLDWPFAILVLTILAFGLIMMFSASYANALWQYDDSLYFIKRQALFGAVGVVAMFVASHVDYHIFHRFAWPLMGATLVLLVLVLFMPAQKGVQRWISCLLYTSKAWPRGQRCPPARWWKYSSATPI